MLVLRLAIPSPLRRLFDYLPPAGMGEDAARALQPGQRLLVPFGRRELTAYLVGTAPDSELPLESLRRAFALLDPEPLIPPSLVALCDWAARYYLHPPGEVFSAAFPRQLRHAGQPGAGEPAFRLTPHGLGLPAGALPRSPRQAGALAMLQAQGGTVAAARLRAAGFSAAILRGLADKGLVEKCRLAAVTRPPGIRPGLALTAEQAAALAALLAAPTGFSCHLLQGVTGSGKTEVYLQRIAHCLAQGRQALVLIPEIGLTPQTLARFRDRFDAGIAVLHSGLGDARRLQAWEAAREGRAHIVIGTRSAVFTPLAQPGLIIVDEEHDGSYKQQDGFRYSARDLAVKRGQLEHCQVILGSATPSLESLANAGAGRYALHLLTRRPGAAGLPAMRALDVRRRELHAGLSGPLLEMIESRLDCGGQVLLFLNRRGYAPTLRCHDCGWIARCGGCDTRLTVHRRRRRLLCHHCNAGRPIPAHCPDCQGTALLTTGLGTEQAEQFLRGHFPGRAIHRVDSDSMQGRHAMEALVAEVQRGEPCILLGTQMLTKGHHFPGVTLVAVLDADALLFSADFRGEERMAQLLTQVAGRAGRADAPGEVVLQTHYPDHPLITALLGRSYAQLASDLLATRRAAGLPPAGQLVALRSDCRDQARGEEFLRQVREAAQGRLPAGVNLVGPLPSPLPRRAGLYRCQLILLAADRRRGQAAAGLLVAEAERLAAPRDLKWSVDVDPQEAF